MESFPSKSPKSNAACAGRAVVKDKIEPEAIRQAQAAASIERIFIESISFLLKSETF